MKTVHFFAFYLHNLPKNTFFAPRSSMNPKIAKSLHFNSKGWGCSSLLSVFRQPISPLQMSNQSFSNFNFRIFEILLLFFMMNYSCFHNEVVEYRLNHHGYCFDFVSDADCNISLPRTRNFQARKILVSCRENFMLNTRIHFILYENEVYSGKE